MRNFIVLITTIIVTVVYTTAKRHKCYYLINNCPTLTIPCPIPAFCGNGTIVNRDGGCCCIPQCGLNEVFHEVSSIQADPTCEQRVPFPSNFGGSPGCFCNIGFVRNKDNKCVSTDECPKPKMACNKNETYSECGQIEKCEPNCKSIQEPDNMLLACPAVCKKGCFCKDGYVRDWLRRCIKMIDCPDPECNKAHEVYNSCYSNCNEPTCSSPRDFFCGYQCKRGCFCEKGYVRNKERKCIPYDECPQRKIEL
ncbi:hypothetical protein PVAND_009012 [Polypedilum vanderplanki]|uniref:TIL domain-containing protein n=1 Tax=Polypedilum vanderplanki TaxID=319348 RepID=A0A9J6CBS5_POLVA|nr:hypothetical protein PVAND_009012 [Polypedilum vanderplanki]